MSEFNQPGPEDPTASSEVAPTFDLDQITLDIEAALVERGGEGAYYDADYGTGTIRYRPDARPPVSTIRAEFGGGDSRYLWRLIRLQNMPEVATLFLKRGDDQEERQDQSGALKFKALIERARRLG